MEESINNKKQAEDGDKEIIYSKTIWAGKRIYYLDVKKNLRDDYFIAVTESKRVASKRSSSSFEKHKIFLYKEDFEKFMEGMKEVIGFIQKKHPSEPKKTHLVEREAIEDGGNDENEELSSDEFKLDIDF